jgi:NAD(P)-dependent dehydrogenase (short-subunit alcohol dehydrogenase family)
MRHCEEARMGEQRVAMVTGAGQGIGQACAEHLARAGLVVVAADMTSEAAEATAAELRRQGHAGISIAFDVADVPAATEAVAAVAKQFGRVDVLVNNAGILHTTAIAAITEAEWDHVLAVNLKGAFFLAQQVLLHMQARRWGRIINVASVAGRMGGYGSGLAYSASKAGLIGLTMGMARHVAEFGITVNAVAPGTTRSPIVAQFSAELLEELRQRVPLKRLGEPKDTAALVGFLASEEAGFITGAVVDVNGGMFMG